MTGSEDGSKEEGTHIAPQAASRQLTYGLAAVTQSQTRLPFFLINPAPPSIHYRVPALIWASTDFVPKLLFLSALLLCQLCFCANTAFASAPLLSQHCLCASTIFVPSLLLCQHCFCPSTALCRHCFVQTMLCVNTALCQHRLVPATISHQCFMPALVKQHLFFFVRLSGWHRLVYSFTAAADRPT